MNSLFGRFIPANKLDLQPFLKPASVSSNLSPDFARLLFIHC
jgi:hypothetical protein